MLWYKAWLDTRWRFLIGLGLLICVALGNALAYPSVHGFLEAALNATPKGELADELRSVAQVSNSFRGYIWVQVISQNLSGLWIILAVLLGADGPLSRRRGRVFTLSLPISRLRLSAVRAAVDLAELFLVALLPMLLIPLLAPAVGQTYGFAEALVHGVSIFLGGAVFYCLARLLAAIFEGRWRPIVIALAVAATVEICKTFIPALAPVNPAAVMDGERYFRTGAPAWSGLVIWLGISMALLYCAARSIEKRDF